MLLPQRLHLSLCFCLTLILSLSLTHSVIDVLTDQLYKNVLHRWVSASWSGYNSSPPLLLIYLWCPWDAAPLLYMLSSTSVSYFSFILARHRSRQIECVSSSTRERQRGNWGTQIEMKMENQDRRRWVERKKETRTETVEEIQNYRPVLACSSPSLCICIFHTHAHAPLHCRWTPKPIGKRNEQRDTRKTELASD